MFRKARPNSTSQIYGSCTVPSYTAAFVLSPHDDMTIRSRYTGDSIKAFRVEIDSTGTPDTYRWSNDGGGTWEGSVLDCKTYWVELEDGIEIKFESSTGHAINAGNGDRWDWNGNSNTVIKYYVDPTSGVDRPDYGRAHLVWAWRSLRYALSQIPRNLTHDIYIYYADDNETITEPIMIDGFFGGGGLYIHGDVTGIPTGTHYEFNGAFDQPYFHIKGCSAKVEVRGIYFDNNFVSTLGTGVKIEDSGSARVYQCYMNYFDEGVYATRSKGEIIGCGFSACDNGILASSQSMIYSSDNGHGVVDCATFSLACFDSVIMTNGNQPLVGGTVVETTAFGGKIFDSTDADVASMKTITDIRFSGATLQYKYRTMEVIDGIIRDAGTESAWTSVPIV